MEVLIVVFIGVAIAIAIRLANGSPAAAEAPSTPAVVAMPPQEPVPAPSTEAAVAEPQPPMMVRVAPVVAPVRPARARKENWREVEALLRREGVRKLYHFTDRANLASIMQHGGLYSWGHCERNGIQIPRPGGDQLSRRLDRRDGLQDYVRVAFNPNHPMMFVAQSQGRIGSVAILEIDPEVLLFEDTLYSDINATKTGASIGGNLSDLAAIDFDVCLKARYDAHEKSAYQAEALIKRYLPLDYVLNADVLKMAR